MVDEGHFTTRKPSSKKGKKLESMNLSLDGDDYNRSRILKNENTIKVKRRPPCGKTWFKQLFAGQLGISLLGIFIGMSIGIPLDITSSSWDASTAAGRRRLRQDYQVEDPYCTIITHPCGPWGSWSRFNLAKGGQAAETVKALRESNREVLKTVNKTVKDRLRAKRHVFIEQPAGTESLCEDEMKDIMNCYITSGDLLLLRVDGCMVGYHDRESKLPHYKPSIYITSMIAAESIFANKCCGRDHRHEPLEGNNIYGSRTTQAAEWPEKLNQLVLDTIIQQAAIETEAHSGVHEAFPSETRGHDRGQGGSPKRQKLRRGRVATLGSNFGTPPVYIRPGQLEDPLPQEPQDDDEAPQDDHEFRAERAAALDPILNIGEGERRQQWLQIDPEIRKILRDLHTNFGHCTNTTLQRILRRQGAKEEAIRGTGLLACDACGDSIRAKRPKPVRLPNRYEFNRHILMDTFFAKDSANSTYAFLNIVCDATGFQVVCCMGLHSGVPSSSVALRHFATSWTSWCGLPYSIQVDRGKEFMARFADHLKTFGVEQEVMPLAAPWKGGRCERAGGLWKDLWIKTCLECQIVGLDDVILATGIVTQTRNSFPRSNGYSPNQWVLGVPELRLPGSLLTNEAGQQLEVLEAAENPQSQMAKTLQIREAARVAQVRLDTDSRIRRALLRQSTPTRGPYPIGSYVYFYKKQLGPQRVTDKRQYNWFGPARVIGVELRSPRRLEDQDPPTEGGQPHSYWLRYGPSVVLATGEQLRFASEDELLAAHCIPSYAVQLRSLRGARNYVDARPLQLENLNLPGGSVVDFWHVSGDGRVVRVHQQPRLLLFHPADQGCPVDLDQLQNVRVTEAIYTAEARDHALTDTIEDDWRASDPQEQRPLTFQWTGETIFYLINQPDGDDGDMVYTPSVPPQDLPGGEDLPPVPEDNELDAPQPPQPPAQEPQQEIRTGAALPRQTSVAEPEPQPLSRLNTPPDPQAGRAFPFQVPPTPPVGFRPPQPTATLDTARRDPDRLDGYGPTTSNNQPRVYPGPYLADPWPDECNDLQANSGLKELHRLQGQEDGETSTDVEVTEDPPAGPFEEAMLTGKAAVRSEINLAALSPEDRLKFDASVEKEWLSWQKFSAVEILTDEQIQALPDDCQVIGTRWVHTDKNSKPRAQAMALARKTGKSEAQIKAEYPFEVKSRMVVQGCQEQDPGIRSDSPTASLLAFNFVTAITVVMGWTIEAYDASTAYLQSQGISRLLILRPPRPPPPGISPLSLLRAKGSIYGTRDAGRSWWRKLYRVLLSKQWVMSKLEPALFFLYEDKNLTGILISHVDDLYCSGIGKLYEESMRVLEKEIYLKKKVGEFRFCGKNVKQLPDGSIAVDQKDAIWSLDYVVLDKKRRAQPNARLTEPEKTQFRALIGSLGWIARQTRPDVLVNVSIASQQLGSPSVKDMVDLNKVVRVLKEELHQAAVRAQGPGCLCHVRQQLRQHQWLEEPDRLCHRPLHLRDHHRCSHGHFGFGDLQWQHQAGMSLDFDCRDEWFFDSR